MNKPAEATRTEETEGPGHTGSSLLREAVAHIGLDRGLVRTFVDLLVRPGVMLRRALQNVPGSPYVQPIPFLLIISGLWWLAWTRFPPPFVGPLTVAPEGSPQLGILVEYGSFLVALNVLPFTVGTSLVLQSWGRPFVQHLVANAYVLAAANGLVLLLYPIFFSSVGDILMTIVNSVAFLYHPLAFSQLGRNGFPRDFPRAWLATLLGFSLLAVPFLLVLLIAA